MKLISMTWMTVYIDQITIKNKVVSFGILKLNSIITEIKFYLYRRAQLLCVSSAVTDTEP